MTSIQRFSWCGASCWDDGENITSTWFQRFSRLLHYEKSRWRCNQRLLWFLLLNSSPQGLDFISYITALITLEKTRWPTFEVTALFMSSSCPERGYHQVFIAPLLSIPLEVIESETRIFIRWLLLRCIRLTAKRRRYQEYISFWCVREQVQPLNKWPLLFYRM